MDDQTARNGDQPADEPALGFELAGRFYPLRVSDTGKDLMLIDKFAGCSIAEFYDLLDDASVDNTRASILLTLIATSLRAGNPDWSVERIARLVLELNLTDDVVWVGADQEDEQLPPMSAGTGSTGTASSPESKPTSSVPAPAPSETSNAIPA